MSDESSWIKDGKEDAEPVTTETPAAVEEVVADAVEATTEVTEVAETVETTAVEVDADEVTEEVVQKFIEGKLGDEAFQLPEGVLVPVTRNGETEYLSIEDVLKGTHVLSEVEKLHADVQRERSAFGRERADHGKEAARLEAREKFLAERETQTLEALTTEEGALRHQQHLQMMRDNPTYRETFERDYANRETEFERDQLLEDKDQEIVLEASRKVFEWSETLSKEFPGVDPKRVESTYGSALISGKAALDINVFRDIYSDEAAYLAEAAEAATKPLEAKVDALAARIASSEDAKAADKHNETTQHAARRAKTVPVATGSGAPANARVVPEKFGPHQLAEKNQEWADVR